MPRLRDADWGRPPQHRPDIPEETLAHAMRRGQEDERNRMHGPGGRGISNHPRQFQVRTGLHLEGFRIFPGHDHATNRLGDSIEERRGGVPLHPTSLPHGFADDLDQAQGEDFSGKGFIEDPVGEYHSEDLGDRSSAVTGLGGLPPPQVTGNVQTPNRRDFTFTRLQGIQGHI
jgi:hypothetical protein